MSFYRHFVPIAAIVLGLVLTVVWVAALGVELFRVVELIV